MSTRMHWMRRRALVPLVAAVGLVAIAGTALAGHETSGVKSYTGCLVSGDGVLVKIKEGNTPKSACTGGQVEAHFSGGDITSITAQSGGGLTGGGVNGAASLSLRRDCDGGDVVKWNGSAWVCAADSNSTYTAGTGLDLNGGQFSIEPAYRIPGKSCSTAGEFARGFDASGAIQCQAPAASSTGIEVWRKRTTTTIVLPKGEGVDVIQMPLPAGSFLITAVLSVSDANTDDEFDVGCLLRDNAFNQLPVHQSRADIGEESVDAAATITVHDVVTLTTADTVRFTCTSDGGDDERESVDGGTMTAVKVGTVHTP